MLGGDTEQSGDWTRLEAEPRTERSEARRTLVLDTLDQYIKMGRFGPLSWPQQPHHVNDRANLSFTPGIGYTPAEDPNMNTVPVDNHEETMETLRLGWRYVQRRSLATLDRVKYDLDLDSKTISNDRLNNGKFIHQFSFCFKQENKKWFKYDNELVTEVGPQIVSRASSEAYILFYKYYDSQSKPDM